MKKLITCILLLDLCLSALGQEQVNPDAVQKITAEGLNNSKVMDIAYHLTDVAGPRLSNSPGLKKAQDWCIKYLQQMGIQNTRLEPWGDFGMGWQVDKMYVATTLPYYQAVIAAPKAWTPGTNGMIKSDVVLIEVTDLAGLFKYRGKLKGKIVILELGFSSPLQNTYAPDAVRYTDDQLEKLAASENENSQPEETNIEIPSGKPIKQSALMMRSSQASAKIDSFFVAEEIGLRLTLAKGNYGTVRKNNSASYKPGARRTSPELDVSGEDFLHILRLLRAGERVEMEADIKNSFYGNDTKGYNVIGEIEGTDPKLKDEVVMLGAHLDSWHQGTGATDNAAGCAVMIEAIRILKAIGFKPKRTIRLALWSSEEQGLLGSMAYVKTHFADRGNMVIKPEYEKLSAYYNLDNGTGKIRGIYLQGNKAGKEIFQSWLRPFENLGAKTVTIKSTFGTDHISFDRVGLPGFQFIQDPMDYDTRTHHSSQDTFDRLVEDDLKKSAVIVASFVYHTSERTEKLPRKEMPKPKIQLK